MVSCFKTVKLSRRVNLSSHIRRPTCQAYTFSWIISRWKVEVQNLQKHWQTNSFLYIDYYLPTTQALGIFSQIITYSFWGLKWVWYLVINSKSAKFRIRHSTLHLVKWAWKQYTRTEISLPNTKCKHTGFNPKICWLLSRKSNKKHPEHEEEWSIMKRIHGNQTWEHSSPSSISWTSRPVASSSSSSSSKPKNTPASAPFPSLCSLSQDRPLVESSFSKTYCCSLNEMRTPPKKKCHVSPLSLASKKLPLIFASRKLRLLPLQKGGNKAPQTVSQEWPKWPKMALKIIIIKWGLEWGVVFIPKKNGMFLFKKNWI